MPRILTLTTVPWELDPRARRASQAAKEAGMSETRIDARRRGATTRLGSAVRRSGIVARELRGLLRLARLGFTSARLAYAGRRTACNIVHAHDFDTLPAGWWVAQRCGARLVYDAHELYTGFEERPPRVWASAVRMLEGALARRADAVLTVSDGIAAELRRVHALPKTPVVVLNCPALHAVEVVPRSGPIRAVYQAATGRGRDLHDLEAVGAAGVDVTARVVGFAGRLRRVTLAAPVAPAELVRALVPYDVGLVIDQSETRNADLALPNKLFEYFMAGLAVVVPQTTEMARLVESEHVGVVYERGRLAHAVAALAADRAAVDAMRFRARALAVERFNAEAQRAALRQAWGV